MDAHSEMYAPRFAMHRNTPLKWDHKVNLVGVKDPDPMIHNCEKCNFPILSYGRMIPCKHVFCFDCAKATDKSCLRCEDSVQRIEQSPLGSIYLCTYGAPKHSHDGCRRTYLSHRDLLAHINLRHTKTQSTTTVTSSIKDQAPNLSARLDPRSDHRSDPRTDPRGDPRSHPSYTAPHQEGYTGAAPAQTPHIIPDQMQYNPRPPEVTSTQSGSDEYRVNVPVRKSNLITVPLHDTTKEYHSNKGVMMPQPSAQPHSTSTPYPSQAPMVPLPQHQVPQPPPPQHVPYPQHPPASIAHVPPISHASPVSSSYTVPVVPISAHQVPHSMHPPQAPVYTQPGVVPPPMNPPHYDTAPRPPFPTSSTHPAQNPPFPSPGVPIQRPGWPVGPLPPTSMPPPPPPQVPAMVNQVPAMPPQQGPGPRPDLVPPPIVPMSEAPRYHGQYFTG